MLLYLPLITERDQFFIILNKGVEGVPQQEFTPTDEETLNSLIGKSDENESNIDDSELYTPEEDVFDDYDYYLKLEDFIEWVNDNYDAKGSKPKKRLEIMQHVQTMQIAQVQIFRTTTMKYPIQYRLS